MCIVTASQSLHDKKTWDYVQIIFSFWVTRTYTESLKYAHKTAAYFSYTPQPVKTVLGKVGGKFLNNVLGQI